MGLSGEFFNPRWENSDMQWIEPDFTEISLNMEVTAYVRTDGEENESASTRH